MPIFQGSGTIEEGAEWVSEIEVAGVGRDWSQTVSSGDDRTTAPKHSHQSWLPAQDMYKTHQHSHVEQGAAQRLCPSLRNYWQWMASEKRAGFFCFCFFFKGMVLVNQLSSGGWLHTSEFTGSAIGLGVPFKKGGCRVGSENGPGSS